MKSRSDAAGAVPARLQDLAPADAALCLATARFITGELGLDPAGGLFLLAVSGGADSTALLRILHFLCPRLRVQLHVLTVDHGLRPQSGADAAFVQECCRLLGIACTARTVPAIAHAERQGLGLEEASRELRYAALEEERSRIGADWIVTGHQRDDLGEDILLRLLRGAGWPGLGGMPALDSARHLLRPLLLTPARRLRNFLRHCGLTWREDESNLDENFRRNRIRHAILPALEAESPRLTEHMAQLWRMARADEEHWARVLDAATPQPLLTGLSGREESPARGTGHWKPSGIVLERAVLRGLDKAGRLRMYLRLLRNFSTRHGRGQARAGTLFALDRAWVEGRGGTRFQFPGGISAELRQGKILFRF